MQTKTAYSEWKKTIAVVILYWPPENSSNVSISADSISLSVSIY